MALYLFVLNAEILARVIRVCDVFSGLQMGGEERKLSLYAKGTTLFLKDVQNLKRVLVIFRLFKVEPDLPTNMERTKVVEIGASRAICLTWKGQSGLEWASTFDSKIPITLQTCSKESSSAKDDPPSLPCLNGDCIIEVE